MIKSVKAKFSVLLFLFVILSISWAAGDEIVVGIKDRFVLSVADDVGKRYDDGEQTVPLQMEYFRSSSQPHGGVMKYTKPPRSWIGYQFTRPQNEKIFLEEAAEFRVAFTKPLREKWTFMVQDYTRGNPDPMAFELSPIEGKTDYRIPFRSMRNKDGLYKEFNQIILSPPWESSEGVCELAQITILTSGGKQEQMEKSHNQSPRIATFIGHRGFTITGYWRGVYQHNINQIREVLEQYRGNKIHVNILVTFYVDKDANVRIDGNRTPSAKEVNELLVMIQNEFPEFSTGVYFYVDPADGSWRAEIENLDFDTWVEALDTYTLSFDSDLVDLIGISSEMLGVEDNSKGWRRVITLLRSRYPEALIGYATDRNSEILLKASIPVWFNDLDLFGATMWHRGDSLKDLQDGIQRTIDQVHHICAMTGTNPFFSEIGYPSADNALDRPWQVNNDVGTNEALQTELFEAVFGDFSPDDPVYLWRLEPGNLYRPNGYSWLGKRSEGIVEDFLLSPGEPKSTSNWAWNMEKATGVAKVNSRYLPVAREKYDTRSYELTTFDLDPGKLGKPTLILRGSGFSVADSSYNRGSLIVTVDESTFVEGIPLPWRNSGPHDFEREITLPENAKSVTITITPSDWGTVIEQLHVEVMNN
jgi:hypothetical protein